MGGGRLVPRWQAEVSLVKSAALRTVESYPMLSAQQLDGSVHSALVMISLALGLMSDLITRV